ncbi:MAG: flagellar filament capping protein FliD, partial [Spirochaetaceae bacterium]|nr:flagellar filament capping protein FliD [Spirochaetaceae bacterium]
DIFVPGVSSRFGTDDMVKALMDVERLPRNRLADQVKSMETQRTNWQELGRRISSMRDSARSLFSFQNPFNERTVNSSNSSALSGTANRGSMDQEQSFTVTQIAKADRYLSAPLDTNMQAPAGNYGFTAGDKTLSLNFQGGSLQDLVKYLNTEGKGTVKASIINVQKGKSSLLVESLVTGLENRLQVTGNAATLAQNLKFENITAAQDSVLDMDGIKISRPGNTIDDLLPGVNLTVHAVSPSPVEIRIGTNNEAIKESIIGFVGNYNRLMADLNVLTRSDPNVIAELTYLTEDEQKAMTEKLGAFATDSALLQFRSALQQAVSAVYQPLDSAGKPMQDTYTMLSQIGISTNASGRGGGYDASRLRGYLEINEQELDAAIATNTEGIRALFAQDTTGDLVADTGAAYNLDRVARPFVETGGIIALKTNGIDSRIQSDNRRMATLDSQLADKEAQLRSQYAGMESAYAEMERMTQSLDNFSTQNSNNRR